MPSKQETFDAVVAHARKQGVPAKEEDWCRYRTKDGLKCFAGALIPDDRYDDGFEGRSIWTDYLLSNSEGPSEVLRELGYDLNFVRELQKIHDEHHPAAWEMKFMLSASGHGLHYTPPVKEGAP